MTDPARQLQPHQTAGARTLLLPREHGAYTELGFSLATGLALGDFTSTKILLAVSLVLFFIAHEPVVVLIGARGRRRLDEFKNRAFSHAIGLSATGAVLGILGWWQAPPAARAAVLLPLAFGAAVLVMIVIRREKTAAGEMLVAFTFASSVGPIALAGGSDAAMIAGVLWAIIFALQTFTVREVRLRSPQESSRRAGPSAMFWIAAATGVVIVLLFTMTAAFPVIALLPTSAVVAVCGLLRVSARRLRTVGWAFAVSDVLALAEMLAVLR
jgi:hypothetical protein